MYLIARRNTTFACALCAFVMAACSATCASDRGAIEKRINALVDKGCVLLNDENGARIISINPDQALIPASVIKVFTSLAAIDALGEDFRFRTGFYTDAGGNLAIKGWGDPRLISEEIRVITARLAGLGMTEINRVYLDHSSFADDIIVPGVSRTLNPYDAINGALAVNFNTIFVARSSGGKVQSAEELTPLTPLAISKGSAIARGSRQRINLASNKSDCRTYAHELFCAFCDSAGIAIKDRAAGEIAVDGAWRLVYEHRNTQQLTDVISGLLKYSNNFTANQIFLVTGAEKKGYPATLDKSREFFSAYARTVLGLPDSTLFISEGSGISRNNTVTGNAMMHIMERFRNRASLLPSHTGTVVAKSGTLNGVSNYAGYIQTPAGLMPFVIILNQKRTTRDSIVSLLEEYSR